MKNDFNFSDNKKSFFGSKGLYIALSVCLLGAGGATWYSVKKAADDVEETPLPFVSGAEVDTSSEEPPIPQESAKPSEPSISSEDSGDSEKEETSSESFQASAEPSPEYFVMPVLGEILKDYSDGLVVKNETLSDWRTHDGIDIAAAITTPVKSIADGTVHEINYDDLLGTVVVVKHADEIESYYSNLSEVVNVSVGQALEAGHVIGSVGNSAISESKTPDHLHFAIKQNGEWKDPLEIITEE